MLLALVGVLAAVAFLNHGTALLKSDPGGSAVSLSYR